MSAPRDWLVVPSDFGVAAEVRLRSGDPVAAAHARLCHDTIRVVQAAANKKGWDTAEMAGRLLVNRRYLQRKLSGHLPITIHDLACWTQLLDLQVTIS